LKFLKKYDIIIIESKGRLNSFIFYNLRLMGGLPFYLPLAYYGKGNNS